MTPEEYQKLKEAEKAHLRSIRELKKAVRSVSRQSKLADAIEGATRHPAKVLDDHDALVDELAMQTARNEARLDVALDSVSSSSDHEVLAENEDALRRARAAELVRQLRGEMGGSSAAKPVESAPSGSKDVPAKVPDAPLPEKTIGRMKP